MRHASAINVYRPDKMQSSFASGSPRRKRTASPPPASGSNASSVEIDQRSWSQPRVWDVKGALWPAGGGAADGLL